MSSLHFFPPFWLPLMYIRAYIPITVSFVLKSMSRMCEGPEEILFILTGLNWWTSTLWYVGIVLWGLFSSEVQEGGLLGTTLTCGCCCEQQRGCPCRRLMEQAKALAIVPSRKVSDRHLVNCKKYALWWWMSFGGIQREKLKNLHEANHQAYKG